MLEAMGIPVEYTFHEDSPSQHESDLRYTAALGMADNVMTLRLVVRKLALDQNLHATFMPKPLNGVQGSGMHTHMSLFENDVNAFYDAGDDYGLSKTAKAFIAGLLVHAREMTAVTSQLVNSYKRLVAGDEAPALVSRARNNSSALVRVPTVKPGKESSTRVEYRALDSAANPCLAFSAILAAGLKGVQEGYELPPEAAVNLSALSRNEARAMGFAELPMSLAEALPMLTRVPARSIGIYPRKGSLERGADADVILWDENTGVRATFVGGELVYQAVGECIAVIADG